MLKIIKTKVQETITKTVTYETDHFYIVETIVNGELDNITTTELIKRIK